MRAFIVQIRLRFASPAFYGRRTHPEVPVGAPTSSRTLFREVLALAWPAVLQGMIATLVFSTDRLIIGRYGSEALSSLAIASPVAWSITSIFGAYMAGVVAVTGRAVGANDHRRARAALQSSLGFALFIGLLVAFTTYSLRSPIVTLLTSESLTSPTVRLGAQHYLSIVLSAAPFFFLASTSTGALQSAGDTRTPMLIAIFAGILNLSLSWLLVFGHFGLPELGIRGAALGTVAAFTTQGLLAIVVLCLRKGPLRLTREGSHLERRSTLATILKVSRAALGEKILYHLAYIVSIGIVGHLGDTAMAAHESLLGIEAIGFTAAGGLSIAASTLVAQRMGRTKPTEAYRSGQTAAAMGLLIGLIFGALLAIFPEQLIAIFTTDEDVIATGAQCLRIAALAQPAMLLADTWSGALRGAGDTLTPMVAAILGPVLVRVFFCWFFAFYLGYGLIGFWLGTTLDWYVRAAWTGLHFQRQKWALRYRDL